MGLYSFNDDLKPHSLYVCLVWWFTTGKAAINAEQRLNRQQWHN